MQCIILKCHIVKVMKTTKRLFTLGARALVPGHQHKMVHCVQTQGTQDIVAHFSDLVSGMGTSKRCVYISAQRLILRHRAHAPSVKFNYSNM